jgi:hypothetical protein
MSEGSRFCSVLGSIVVSIPACHAGDRGSIPRRGGPKSFANSIIIFVWINIFLSLSRSVDRPTLTILNALLTWTKSYDIIFMHFNLDTGNIFTNIGHLQRHIDLATEIDRET